MTATIFSQLQSEHDQLKELLEKATSSTVKERKAILKDIEMELIPHARGEEKTLYAKILENAKEEEEDLFPKAKSILDSKEQQEIHMAYQEAKEKFSKTLPTQSQISPRTASKSLHP